LTAIPKQKFSLPCCLAGPEEKNTAKAQNSKLANKRLVKIVTNLQ
jgi:hypothetical protein